MERRKKGGWEAGGERLDRLLCVLFLRTPFHWPAPLSSAPSSCLGALFREPVLSW